MTIRTEGFFVAPTSQAEIPSAPAAGRRATWEGTTGPVRWLRDIGELSGARNVARGVNAGVRQYEPEAAADWMNQRGLEGQFKFDRPYNERELEILARRKSAELRRASILSRAEGGGLTRFGVSLAASLVDPINIASGLIPFVGPARYARMLKAAGSAAGRAGVRAQVGAVEGLAGMALLEPLNYVARRQEQADYTLTDAMHNILMGAPFGAVLHVGGGALLDTVVSRRSLAVPDVRQTETGVDIVPRQAPTIEAPAGQLWGRADQVKVGEAYVPTTWAVVDADQLAPTLQKAENQYRDRNRAAAQQQVREIAARLDFNLVAESPLMDFGAPTLSQGGDVIGGNGRLAAIQMAYGGERGALYRDALIDRARQFGVSPEAVKAIAKPILVRLLRQDVDIRRAAAASNEGGAMRMSALEQAKVDAERLGDLRAFELNEDGQVSVAKSRDAVRHWVEEQPATQRAALLDSTGQLSAEGLQRLRNGMLFRAYGDSPTLARLIEAVDPGSRNVAAALLRIAPRMGELRAAIEAGDRFDLDLSKDLQAAVERLAQIRDSGQAVSEALAQGELLGAALSPEARQILAFMGEHLRSSRAMADFLGRYLEAVEAAGSPKQASLFGDATPPSRLALLQQAAGQYTPTAAELIEMAPRENQLAAMKAAVVQAAQGEPIQVEAIIASDTAGLVRAAERASDPDAQPLADPRAVEAIEEQANELPGNEEAELAVAEKELAEAEEALNDTVEDLQAAGILKSEQLAGADEHVRKLPSATQRTYLQMRETATAAKATYDVAVQSIAARVGGEAVTPPLKSTKASVEKIQTELGGVAADMKDLIRATVMVDSIEQARDALAAAEQVFEIVGKPRRTLLEGKSSDPSGYRDIKLNFRVGGIVGELQINTRANIKAKDGLDFKGGPGHTLYEQIRSIERRALAEDRDLTKAEAAEKVRLQAESRQLYEGSFAESRAAVDPRLTDTSAQNSASETLTPFRWAEEVGNRRGGSTSKARASSSGLASSTRTGTPSTSKNENLLPMDDILAQLPPDLQAEALAVQQFTEEADRLAEVARRASVCALRSGS